MFPPVLLSHDDVVDRARQAAGLVTRSMVTAAFIASFGLRMPALRSALASYHLARVLPVHGFASSREPVLFCDVCGRFAGPALEDLSVLSFERLKWGGVRRFDPLYIAFDLERVAEVDVPAPTEDDIRLLRELFVLIRDVAREFPFYRPSKLTERLRDVLPGNRYVRRGVLEVLGLCGVLHPSGRPKPSDRWVNYVARPDPPESDTDWQFPIAFWRGNDGLDETRLAELFPELLW